MAGLDDPDWDPMEDVDGDIEFLDPEDGIMKLIQIPLLWGR